MLKRKIQEQLLSWKNDPAHKSLMLLGARQVGKTFSCRQFAAEHYENLAELNFIENPELKSIFSGSLRTDDLLAAISLYMPGTRILPGRTLLVFDEAQECPQAITSLKFWTEDHRFDVIATGSGLGLKYKTSELSFPVGSVQTMRLHSLDFEEFLWAEGITDEVIQVLHHCFDQKEPVPDAVHIRMMELLRRYMVIGGMPEIVQAYEDTHDMLSVHNIQKRIYSDYLFDIARYAQGNDKMKAEKCYRSIPVQLSKENHKFQYGVIEHKATSAKFASSIDWLNASFLTEQVFHIKRPEFPPELYMDETNFRLYMTDIGLLMGTFSFELKKAVLEDKTMEQSAGNLVLGTVKGALYEALAADMLLKKDKERLYFYKDEKSSSEIEFFYVNADGLIPVEIKAGKKRANSLARILESDKIPYGYKLSSQNVGISGKRITCPMYMLLFIA